MSFEKQKNTQKRTKNHKKFVKSNDITKGKLKACKLINNNRWKSQDVIVQFG